jgi:bis(5'-nucleosyl)-tetraphosphatase (symmetrical)
MAVFAIGDVQGCRDELDTLLDRLQFDASRDRLWFVGDLVNRGPRSLDTLRFVKSLGDAAIAVLGNHDLHLLAIARGGAEWRGGDEGLRPIVEAQDAEELLDWLQARPLLHHDAQLGISLLHAGLPPQWNLQTAEACAIDVQRRLRGEKAGQLYERMYGNEPDTWRDDLDGWDRIRFTINAFTRLRVCDAVTGRMALKFKGAPANVPSGT